MLGPIARITNNYGRNVMKSFTRNGSNGGVPGENLPFNIHSKYGVTFHFFWFFATGFGSPFLILLHQLKKNST